MTVKQIKELLSEISDDTEVKIDLKNPMGGGFLLNPSGFEKNNWEDFVSIVIGKSASKYLFESIIDELINQHKETDMIVKEIKPKTKSRYEYRKVEKWYVVEFEDGHFQIENTKKYMDVLFEGSKEECEKWLEEHTKKTWLEEYLYSNYGENAQYYIRIGAKEVCKKILEELNKNGSECHQTVEHIIQNLGVEI